MKVDPVVAKEAAQKTRKAMSARVFMMRMDCPVE
jgi:hypothetical protein